MRTPFENPTKFNGTIMLINFHPNGIPAPVISVEYYRAKLLEPTV